MLDIHLFKVNEDDTFLTLILVDYVKMEINLVKIDILSR